ncbi:MAG: deoxyribose-phosphate aldolase [Candidatus Odinarchaeota archaeon]|nr:deoxyribose-phosphate aldolase [Candidatus Odinarchaeota archaeon]
MIKITPSELAKKLEQSKLNEDATEDEMIEFFQEAKRYNFYGVAVLPSYVPLASRILKGSGIRVVAGIAFPLGSSAPELKKLETEYAVNAGADEVDVVINHSALFSGHYDVVEKELKDVVKSAMGKPVKAIVELGYLDEKSLEKVCKIIIDARADFIKTSTGFKRFTRWRPTFVEDIIRIKQIVGDQIKIKASGGIKTTEQALAMLVAGADRIGTSSGKDIIEGLKRLNKNLK